MRPVRTRLAVTISGILSVVVLVSVVPSAWAAPSLGRPGGSPRVPQGSPAEPGASVDPGASPDASSMPPTPAPTSPLPDCVPLPSFDPGLPSPEPGASPTPILEASPGPSLTPKPTVKPKATPKPAGSGSTTRHKVPEVGLRLDLPSDWIGLDQNELTGLADIPLSDEWLTYLMASQLVFEGVDVLPGDACAVGTNVSIVDMGADIPIAAIEVSAAALAVSLGNVDGVQGDVAVKMVELPAGTAARLRFHYLVSSTEIPMELVVEGDILAISGHTVMIGFSSMDADSGTAYKTFTTIAKSIRKL